MPDLATLRFLDPAAGIFALSIGLPILLIFYFLKLRRRPVRVSSSMLWQDAARDLQVNVPWRLIRPSWLLLLQLLILSLLAAALARPVLEVNQTPPGRTIIVIDQSASMGAPLTNSQRTRLDEAKSRADQLIERATAGAGGSDFVVVAAAARPVVRYSDGSDRGAAIAAIQSIEQTDDPGDPEPLFQLLKALAATAPSDATAESGRNAARIVLFSDGGDFDRLQIGSASVMSGLGDVNFDFVRVAEAAEVPPPSNAGVVAFSARRDYDDPTLIRVFCAIESNAPRARTTSLRALFSTESDSATLEVGAWPIDLPRATSDGPGRVTKSFDLVAPVGGVLEVRLSGTDALTSDNAAWIVINSPAPPRIWLVRPDDATDTSASASLRDAIEAIVGSLPRALSLTQYEQAITNDSPPDLIVFDAVRPRQLPSAATISFGAGLPIPGLIVESPDPPRPTQFAFWTRSDPLMRGVTFAGTTVFRPSLITLPDTESSASTVRSARVIARGSDAPLIAELRDAARRLIIGFRLDDTNWWKEPSFPVFMANAIEQLGSTADTSGDAGRITRTGDSVTIPWKADTSQITLTGPNGFERTLPPVQDATLAVPALPFVGVYSATGQDGSTATLAASLLDPVETSLATRDTLSIGGRSVASTAVERLAPKEVWWWFVLAAAALLFIEWWAYALRMRT
ncbi:MAG: BatA domain-containing protein [Phycisphaerales bacterium]|nr:BatA domain-containing protein [Phycisphaerales bacterium]